MPAPCAALHLGHLPELPSACSPHLYWCCLHSSTKCCKHNDSICINNRHTSSLLISSKCNIREFHRTRPMTSARITSTLEFSNPITNIKCNLIKTHNKFIWRRRYVLNAISYSTCKHTETIKLIESFKPSALDKSATENILVTGIQITNRYVRPQASCSKIICTTDQISSHKLLRELQ